MTRGLLLLWGLFFRSSESGVGILEGSLGKDFHQCYRLFLASIYRKSRTGITWVGNYRGLYVQISTCRGEILEFSRRLSMLRASGVPSLCPRGGPVKLGCTLAPGTTCPFLVRAGLSAPLGWILLWDSAHSVPAPSPRLIWDLLSLPASPSISPSISISISPHHPMPDGQLHGPMRRTTADGRAMDRESDDIRPLFLSPSNLGVVPAVSDLSWNALPLGVLVNS